ETMYKNLSIPITMRSDLKASSGITMTIMPFLDTMEVRSILQIFHIPETVYSQLLIPKGLQTFLTLPVDLATIYFSTSDLEQPSSVDLKFRAPGFKFMPKLDFRSVTGTLFVTFHNSV